MMNLRKYYCFLLAAFTGAMCLSCQAPEKEIAPSAYLNSDGNDPQVEYLCSNGAKGQCPGFWPVSYLALPHRSVRYPGGQVQKTTRWHSFPSLT